MLPGKPLFQFSIHIPPGSNAGHRTGITLRKMPLVQSLTWGSSFIAHRIFAVDWCRGREPLYFFSTDTSSPLIRAFSVSEFSI